MRAAIYARYSSDHQRDASIEDQVRLCRDWLNDKGLHAIQTYADRAVSGSTLLRAGIQALMEDCMAGKIDIVIAEALDRLSRDQADIAGLYKRLSFAGVQLFTLSEGEITDLQVGLNGTMNALYLKDLADKTRRGLRGRVEAGRSGGGNSYGYDVVAGPEGDRGIRRINQAEAEFVRRIFKEYAAGKSPREIAFGLNADQVPGPTGRDWGPSTINGNRTRGTGILNNEIYVGRLVWNRLRYVKNPDTGKRISRLNPETAWIVRELPECRIVPRELWDAVKHRQGNVKRGTRPYTDPTRPFWQQIRPRYLLSGLMKCGTCGGSYTKISANLFGCATARSKGTCRNRLNVRRGALESLLLDGLKSQLMDEELFAQFSKEFTRELNLLRNAQTANGETAKTEAARVSRQIEKLVMAIADGADAPALNDKIKELEARRDALKAELASMADEPVTLIHPSLPALYRRKITQLADLLDDPTTKDEAFEAIRSLIEEVRLIPKDGQLTVEIKGELAGILSLCQAGGKERGSWDPANAAQQIKAVAGARYPQLRTPVSCFIPTVLPDPM